MKILFVCSGNDGFIQPFIKEQAESLIEPGISVSFFVVIGKGLSGYLKNILLLRKQVRSSNIDLIHAHYGLSGLLSIFQRKAPVVITFHGSDIHIWWVRILSSIAARFAAKSIFVSRNISDKLKIKNSVIIPCGVDTEKFIELEKRSSREKLGLEKDKNILLFASGFDNEIKNYPLAKKATELIGNGNKLIELKGYNREELILLLNASDLLLLTSFSEGSPQIIKEAMACNCPVVATDVGDIKEVTLGTDGCYLTSFNPEDVSIKINRVLADNRRTNGRNNIMKLDTKLIAQKIIAVYKEVINK